VEHSLLTRIKNYWTKRSHDFYLVRKDELLDSISERWLHEMEKYLPAGKQLRILDVGTGSGYFSILLAKRGHRLTGVDLTPAMLEEAITAAAEEGLEIEFLQMDAQDLTFADNTFDAIVTRNLTWTLPDTAKAYASWHRVLKPGGILLNFDAAYGSEAFQKNGHNIPNSIKLIDNVHKV
jgi:ubiquinone/menaquinone biosynthesis C-methylase UbiE